MSDESKCQKCQSTRLASVSAKCSDMCGWHGDGYDHNGYVPGMGIGGGDYVEFEYCLDCGQIQGEFPISTDAARAVQIEELDKRARYLRIRLGERVTSEDHRRRLCEELEGIEGKLEELVE